MATRLDTRQSRNRSALPEVGSAANESLDGVLGKIDTELGNQNIKDLALQTESDKNVVNVSNLQSDIAFPLRLKQNGVSGVKEITEIICVADSNGSLDAKYFILQDDVGTVGFWIDVDNSGTTTPGTGAAREVEITTITTGMTRAQVGTAVYNAIIADSKFEAGVNVGDGRIRVQSSTTGAKTNGLDGDTNFYISEYVAGVTESLDRVIAIENIRKALTDTTNIAIQPIDGSIPVFASGTVTLPASSGSNITVSSGNPVLLTIASDKYKKLLIAINSVGELVLYLGTDQATKVAAQNELVTTSERLLGEYIISTTGSNVNDVINSDITQYSGGGGSGSGSGSDSINYILNNSAIVNTDGWTASSGFFAIARSTTTPLRGAADFSLTKSANNAQNAYIGYDFTIDSADLSSILTISMDIETITAGIADNDFSVRIYDNTAAAYIPLATEPILAGKGLFVSSFQTHSANTSYSLRFFVNTTSAAAMGLAATNIFVGKKAIVTGVPATDWESFTPTGAWSTNTTYTGKYRRVGDTAEFDITVALSGAPNSATLNVNLPSGLSIDTNKITGTSVSDQKLGDLYLLDNGTANIAGSVCYSTATVVTCRYMFDFTGNTGVASVTQTAPFTFANGDKVNLRFSAPIAGWSSNVQMSETTLNKVIAVNAYRNSSQSVTSNTNDVQVLLDTVLGDSTGSFNVGTNSYIIPESAWYSVQGSVDFQSAASSTYRLRGKILADAVVIDQSSISGDTSGNATTCKMSSTVFLEKGAVITLYARSLDDGNYVISGGSHVTYLSISKVGGNSQTIAVSEKVFVKYSGNSGEVIVANTTNVVWNDKVVDTHGAWSGSIFTAPKSGEYMITGNAAFTGATASNARIAKNTTSSYFIGTSISSNNHHFSTIVDLVKGDTISIRFDGTAGTLVDSTNAHNIEIRSL